jgi:hypothetical protein
MSMYLQGAQVGQGPAKGRSELVGARASHEDGAAVLQRPPKGSSASTLAQRTLRRRRRGSGRMPHLAAPRHSHQPLGWRQLASPVLAGVDVRRGQLVGCNHAAPGADVQGRQRAVRGRRLDSLPGRHAQPGAQRPGGVLERSPGLREVQEAREGTAGIKRRQCRDLGGAVSGKGLGRQRVWGVAGVT